ncbi:MAG: NTF2 fold immunity protein [Spirochaetales bacterium]|nr:NTF2 fold immunity protein [Spirochaetales bacterium]
MRNIFFLLFSILFANSIFAEDFTKSAVEDLDIGAHLIIASSDGFVPNEEGAIKIAEIILAYQYGEEIIRFRPFKAELTEDETVWYIKGTFPSKNGFGYYGGGVPHMKIAKKDGRIIGFIHEE